MNTKGIKIPFCKYGGLPVNRIDEMINWYKENATRREYTLIKAKLKLIKSLLDEIENSEDRIFVDEIIDNLECEER